MLLDSFINDIKDKSFDNISTFLFYDYIQKIKDEEFNLTFYQNFHQDLIDKQDIYCIYHYYNYGKIEGRLATEKNFYKIFPLFNIDEYISIYSKDLKGKNKYQILNDYFYNFNNKYSNLKELMNKFESYDIDFKSYYFKFYNDVREMDYYKILIYFIEKKKLEIYKNELNEIYQSEKNNLQDLMQIFNLKSNPHYICNKILGLVKQYSNVIYSKKTFYNIYPDFDYKFYNFITDRDLSEANCISDFIFYGKFQRIPYSQKKLESDFNTIEEYQNFKNQKKKYYILLNNYYGGSYKYIDDIFKIYKNNTFIIIKKIKDLEKIEKDDYLIINFPKKEYLEKILNLKRHRNFKVIINLHDFFWFSDKFDINDKGVYKNYITYKDSNISSICSNFLNRVDILISPSNFVFDQFKKKKINNLRLVPHIDFKILHSAPKKQIMNDTINIGIIHNYTEYKGKDLYEIFKKTYQNVSISNIKINFKTLSEEIKCFDENEYFDIIENENIHALLFLNRYGETWCYSFSKALKTGLPILYNSIGAIPERTNDNELYHKLFDNHEDIENFITSKNNIKILNKFESFIKKSIDHHKKDLEIYRKENINLELNTNLFYDSLYGNYYTKEIIDLYAIYFPQFHIIEQNNKNFYEGYTDFENLKILKNKNPSIKYLTPKYDNYNLEKTDIVKDHIKLAKEYNFKGFGCYYYWFSDSNGIDNMIMRKVVDKLFEVNDDEFKLFFIWANEDWTNESYGRCKSIVNSYDNSFLNKNAKNLIPYFKNPKYLLEENKPVLFIYHPWLFPEGQLNQFEILLNDRCKSEGFDGCKIVINDIGGINNDFKNFSIQPNYKQYKTKEIDYKDFYNKLSFNPSSIQSFFFNFDSSPRMIKPKKKEAVRKFLNNDEESFKENFFKTIQHYSHRNKGIDKMLIINSWNEWGEQMAIEPSKEKGNYFLDLIKSLYESPLSL